MDRPKAMKCDFATSRVIGILLVLASQMAPAVELMTFKCDYDRYSDGEELKKAKEPLALIFVTGPNGEATLVGNNGSSKVTPFWNLGGQGVGFVEITQTGNIMTTTIDAKRVSVHSRHTMIGGNLVPSQYYGQCVVQ